MGRTVQQFFNNDEVGNADNLPPDAEVANVCDEKFGMLKAVDTGHEQDTRQNLEQYHVVKYAGFVLDTIKGKQELIKVLNRTKRPVDDSYSLSTTQTSSP